jgi:hypothetical protein
MVVGMPILLNPCWHLMVHGVSTLELSPWSIFISSSFLLICVCYLHHKLQLTLYNQSLWGRLQVATRFKPLQDHVNGFTKLKKLVQLLFLNFFSCDMRWKEQAFCLNSNACLLVEVKLCIIMWTLIVVKHMD